MKFCDTKSDIWTSLVNQSLFSFSDLVNEFLGNQTHTDHFKLLKQDGSSLLIGARNVVYNLTLPNLSENLEQVRHFPDNKRLIVKGKPRYCLDFVALEYYGPQKFWETKTFVKLNLKLVLDIKRFNSQISLHQIILFNSLLSTHFGFSKAIRIREMFFVVV